MERQMRHDCPGFDRPNLLAEKQVLMIAAQERLTSMVKSIAHHEMAQSQLHMAQFMTVIRHALRNFT
jgi:hypothetical protein